MISTYMASQSEEILSLSLAKEKDTKEVVNQQDHVGEDESGDEVLFTSGIQFHGLVVHFGAYYKLEGGREWGEGRGERERECERELKARTIFKTNNSHVYVLIYLS